MKGWALVLVAAALALIPAGAARAQDSAVKLHYNLWCFNVLVNVGMRHGYTDEYHARMAAHAMADAWARAQATAVERGMPESDFDALDRRYFASTGAEAPGLVDGTAPAELTQNYDGCRSRGLRGLHAEKRHAGLLAEREEQLWCQMVMAHFTVRQMIGGGPERAERGAMAARVLQEIVDEAFKWAAIAVEDRDLLLRGTYFRTLIQVEAFGRGGGKERMERDYEPCFAMASLPFPAIRFDFPPPAEVRAARTPAAWDYPLSFEFRQNIWCRELVRLIDTDPLIARTYTLNETGRAEIADYADIALAAEAEALDMPDADFEAVALDTRRQVTYEFQRFDATGNYDELAYDFGSCTYLGAEDRLEELSDLLFGETDDTVRMDEHMWCLAAFEVVLLSGQGDPAGLRAGIDHFAAVAMGIAPRLGLDRDAVMAQAARYQAQAQADIRTRPAPGGGGLMIDYCVTLLPL